MQAFNYDDSFFRKEHIFSLHVTLAMLCHLIKSQSVMKYNNKLS